MPQLPPTAATVFSWDLSIAGVYNEDYGNLRSSFSIGGMGTSGCRSVQFEFDIYDPVGTVVDSIPKQAEVILSGVGFVSQPFFINSRTSADHVCHCVCYDRICKTDRTFVNDLGFGMSETVDGQSVLEHIAVQCGFSSYSGAEGLSEIKFSKSDLENKSCRDLLDEITEALCSVAICGGTDGSVLQIACFGAYSLSSDNVTSEDYAEVDYRGKTVVSGLHMASSETGEIFSFGDASGYVIEIETRFASAALAQAVWRRVNGYVYKSWNCEKALCISASRRMGTANFTRSGVDDDPALILGNPLFATDTEYSFDSTGIYFSGGAAPFNDWQYETKLERQKIGVNKRVGNTVITESGRIVFINKNK